MRDELQLVRHLWWPEPQGHRWPSDLAVCLFGIYTACHVLTSPSVGSGRSAMTSQSFQEFLGPLWSVVKDKYGEWLNTTYSKTSLKHSLSIV